MTEKTTDFLSEIAEQPQALMNLIAHYDGREERDLLQTWTSMAKQSGRVSFSGMGTSEFTPHLILTAMAQCGVDGSTFDAGELLHYPQPSSSVMVLLSQSGESVEVRKLAERLSRNNLIAITNNPESSLARNAALVLPLLAGREKSISTKTYVNTLAVLFLMAESLREQIPLDRLKGIVDSMSQYDTVGIRQAAERLADADVIHFISRGPAMVAARQSALTFMEGTRTSGIAFTGGAFRHGPFELVDERHRCVFFLPGGKTFDLLKKMVLEVSEKHSRVVVVTDQDIKLPGPNICVLQVPEHGEDLFCLSAVTTQELLLDAVAEKRGLTAGIFRYGQKITAME